MIRNLTLLFVTVALTLLLAEGVLRLVYHPATSHVEVAQLYDSLYHMPDPELMILPRPGVHGTHDKQGSFSSTFSTNSMGMRDREHSIGKPPGTTRIVVIGDSFAWGFGVDDDAIFPALVEQRLTGVEVINMGVSGYGLREEMVYFRRTGVDFHPDLLLVALVQNDIAVDHVEQAAGLASRWAEVGVAVDPVATRAGPDASGDGSAGSTASPVEADGGDAARPAAEASGAFVAIKRRLGASSHLYALVTDAIDANRTLSDFLVRIGVKAEPGGLAELDLNVMPALIDAPDPVRAGWDTTFERLRELRTLTDSMGIRLVVALVPALQAVVPGQMRRSLSHTRFRPADFDVHMPYRRLEEFLAGENIQVINPLAAFRTATAAGETLYLERDMHFSERGHALFADAIVSHLERMGVGRPVRPANNPDR